ncbi:MAG: hypothetical protein WBP72_02655 [Rhodocyclaceae bacterium]
MWSIDFSSDQFLPYLPEQCQANPGAYGFELAQWLSQELMKRGLVTGYPLGEDWGWFIEYLDGATEIVIGCSSVASEGEGYQGNAILWRVFVRQSLSIKQRLKGAAAPAKVREIADFVATLLRSAGIAATVTEG